MTQSVQQVDRPRTPLHLAFVIGWLPFIIGMLLLISTLSISVGWWQDAACFAVLLCLPYYFIMAVVWACKRRWAMLALSVGSMAILAGTFVFCAFVMMFISAFGGPAEDGFADNLTLPTDVELAEPIRRAISKHQPEFESENATDPFQDALLRSLTTPAGNDAKIYAKVSNLELLATNHPKLLLRYLSARPEWRVFEERGKQYATRRWKIGGKWQYELHGYYSAHDLESDTELEQFQTRFTIGLEGSPWARLGRDTTRVKMGEWKNVKLSEGNGIDESHCVIAAGPIVLEIFEQSIGKERRLTKAAIRQFESELKPLVKTPTEETLLGLLPAEERKTGQPDLILSESFQGGIYDGEVWCNPGEPGMIYLRAYEIMTGRRLSAGRLREKSSERVNWSDDPNELSLAKTNFKIYEGDWGQYYGARFEVWFEPDSGKAERKLLEKNFKIEGWMH